MQLSKTRIFGFESLQGHSVPFWSLTSTFWNLDRSDRVCRQWPGCRHAIDIYDSLVLAEPHPVLRVNPDSLPAASLGL